MAKSSSGLNIAIDAKELVDFAKRIAKATDTIAPSLREGLNDVGDQLVAQMARSLVDRTGLSIEQVRGLMTVKRATQAKVMHYDVTFNHGLFESEAQRRLEGKREDTDFGKRRPGALVIIVTQKDDLVCMDCEALEAAGPMPVEVAERHWPTHPNCRCVMLPYVPKGRRLPVTMTSVTGTSTTKRGGAPIVDADLTLRQMAQQIMDKTVKKFRIELTK